MLHKFILFSSLIVALFLVTSTGFTTIPEKWKVTSVGKSEGLPTPYIFLIQKDKTGYMWFGSMKGIIRYDGKKFLSFKHNKGNSNSLSIDNAGNIYLDSKNNLWVGTFGGGLNIFNLNTNEITRFPYTENGTNSTLPENVQTIYEDNDGRIWIGTTSGLFIYNNDRFIRLSEFNKNKNSIGFIRIWSLLQIEDDSIWVGSSNGLTHFDVNTSTTKDYVLPEEIKNKGYSSQFRYICYMGELIWIGTATGLLSFNPTTKEYKAYTPPEYISKINVIKTISPNKLLIGSISGLYEFNLKSEKFSLNADAQIWNAFPQNDIRDMYYDNNRLLWLTTRNSGLIKIETQGKGNPFNHVLDYITDETDRSKNKNIWVMENNTHGDIFFGTSDSVYQKSNDEFRTISLANGNKISGRILSLYFSKSSGLWIGTLNGLFNYNVKNKYATVISTPFDLLGISKTGVYAIEESKPGEFWLSLFNEGVIYWNSNTNQANWITNPQGEIIDFNIVDILYDSHGYMWFVSSLRGLYKLNPVTNEFKSYIGEDKLKPAANEKQSQMTEKYINNYLPSNKVNSIFEDSSNRIWIATLKGLDEYNRDTDLFYRHLQNEGLNEKIVRSIAEDENKNIWLSNDIGLIRYDPNTGFYDQFMTENEIQINGLASNSLVINDDNTVYLAGQEGYYTIDANSVISDFEVNPDLRFTNIEIEGNQTPFNQLNKDLKKINLVHPVNKIVIDFSILDFLSKNQTYFEFRIPGYLDEWTDVSENRQISLVNLHSGNYPIEIRGSNSQGRWSSNQLHIDLTISTPWWKNIWFWAAAISLMFLSIFIAFKLRTRAINRRNLFLEKMVERRTSELKKLNIKLTHIAHTDSLTQLPNRLQFKKIVEQYINNNVKGSAIPFFMMFIDLDDFKTINDSQGHNQGDSLLMALSQKLNSITTDDFIIARLGGDEFLVFAANSYIEKNREDQNLNDYSKKLANRILDLISQPIKFHDTYLRVTASIGISIYPENGDNYEILLKNADIAMYKAKKSGRNLIQNYTKGMDKQAKHRFKMVENIKQGLLMGSFIPYFQPQFSLTNNKFENVEVLARWLQTDGTMIQPIDFIPIAEETHLIVELENQIYESACRLISKLISQGKFHGRMAINLSAVHFNHVDVIEQIDNILTMSNFPSKHLEIEITESSLISNLDHALKTIKQFKQRDILVTIDDFGTGYSSLGYLSKYPVDCLKIDASLIADLMQNQKNKTIVETIINLAHSLDLTVVAEGVENQDDLQHLVNINCDEVQGYYYSKPLPFESYENNFT